MLKDLGRKQGISRSTTESNSPKALLHILYGNDVHFPENGNWVSRLFQGCLAETVDLLCRKWTKSFIAVDWVIITSLNDLLSGR